MHSHRNRFGLGRTSKRAASPSQRGHNRQRRRRLLVEALEDRRLLSASSAVPDFAAELLYDHADSRILVKFDGAVSDAEAVRLGAARRLGNTEWWQVPVGTGQGVANKLASMRKMEGVVAAQLDYRVQAAVVNPDDQLFQQGCLWGLQNRGSGACGFTSAKVDADIDADQAWDVTVGNGEVVVAVIDSGVDYTHPDLVANIWKNLSEIPGNGEDDDNNGYVDDVRGWDFVNNDNEPLDDNAHGTHVAGTIGAQGNNNGEFGTGMAGVAWNVQIMPLKFLDRNGSGYTSDAIAALNYAVANGAKISNNSWGGAPYDSALYAAIQAAGDAGHLFIAASGNGNLSGKAQNNDSKPYYPASYGLDNIIAVTASDPNDKYSSFGNYGATSVDLAAPGVYIWSTIPAALDTFDYSPDGYARFNGTSMATPHVSGTAALMWSVNPTLSYQTIKQLILDTGDSILNTQRPTVTNDRLNAFKAVVAARDLVPNNLPVAGNDEYSISEDGVLVVAAADGVLGNDGDPDGNPLTAVVVSGPANGNLALNADGSFTYTPNTNFFGTDAFTYAANDGRGVSTPATVSITVTPVNDAPVAAADTATTNINTPVTINILANDSDVDHDQLRVAVTVPGNGSVLLNSDNTITYTPNPGFVGSDSFDYTISDGDSATATATVTVHVQPQPVTSFNINNVAIREGRAYRTTAFTFTVTRSGDTSSAVTVYFATKDGTARAGVDYRATSGALTFGVGETTKTISVTVYGDQVAEYDETFLVQLKDRIWSRTCRGHGDDHQR